MVHGFCNADELCNGCLRLVTFPSRWFLICSYLIILDYPALQATGFTHAIADHRPRTRNTKDGNSKSLILIKLIELRRLVSENEIIIRLIAERTADRVDQKDHWLISFDKNGKS